MAIICHSFNSNAQVSLNPNKLPDQYNFEHWTSDDGLPDNAIIKVIQSKNGYIWFCSYGGVTRFNGAEFFTYSSYNSPEIVNNSFTNIYEDHNGLIWAATSGNGAIVIGKDTITAYTVESGLPSNFVESFVEDKNGRLWVATSEGISYKEGDHFVNEGIPDKLKGLNVVSIDCDENNHLWIATKDDGVIQYTGKKIQHYTSKTGLIYDRINNIRCQKGAVYVGTREGLNIIRNDSIETYTVENGLLNNMVVSTELTESGQLWIGSYQGFARLTNQDFEYFSNQHPIYGRDVTSSLEDYEGNLWVSTYRNGLFKFWEGKFVNYSDYSLVYNDPYTVHSIIQLTQNEFIIVYEEGVSVLNTSDNKISVIIGENNKPIDKMKCGILDSEGRLWVGSRTGLFSKYGNSISVFKKEQGLIDDNIRCLMEDSKGNIWAGTFSGITIIDHEKNVMNNLSTKEGLSNDYIMHINEDSKGSIWISTRNGLNEYNNGKITHYNSSHGMAGDFVFKTFIDADGILWVAGNAGLSRYKNGEFKALTTKNGLTSNTLFQIIEDDNGYFWFTTNQKGVSVFKVKKDELNDFFDGKIGEVNSTEYNQADGIKATAATSSSTSIKADDGKLWIATQQGVEVIDPLNIEKNEILPPVIIEYLNVNDQQKKIDDKIILPYGKNRIEIGFASLSYRFPQKNNYKYQLIGYDEDWNIDNGEMKTSYTNLSSGNYTFKVIASNNDGVWNELGDSISFTIQTPYYRTSWFYFICVFSIVGLGLFVYRWRISSLEAASLALEQTVAERTNEILQKKEEIEAQKEEIDAQRGQIQKQHNELKKVNAELENIVEERTAELKITYNELIEVNKELDTFIYRAVHDIRGPIARLQGLSHLIEIQSKDTQILDLVQMLNNTADDMNDMFYRLINIIRLKTSDLEFESVSIAEIIADVVNQFKADQGKFCDITVNVQSEISIISHQKTLKMILVQLLDNAFKFRKTDSVAQIVIDSKYDNNNNVVIAVSDDGIGIDDVYINNVFDMFYAANDTINSAGLGLYAVKTAVRVLKGDVKIVSNAMHNQVTTFEVTISNMSLK